MALVLAGTDNTVTPGVCTPWTDADTVRGDVEDLQTAPDAIVNLALQWASDSLFTLAGHRWPGLCSDTVRPLGDHRCVGGWSTHRPAAGLVGVATPAAGGWYGHGCAGIPEVDLGVYPLSEIIAVTVDGQTLDPAAYRIDNARLLTRVDGQGWPCWQDVTLAPTEVGTWQVTFVYGSPPPAGGQGAATIYARELALALIGSGKCRLPSRTQTVARQGVTVVAYPQSILDGGRTGLPEVDGWLASVNPQRIRYAATVASPDFPPGVRRTGG